MAFSLLIFVVSPCISSSCGIFDLLSHLTPIVYATSNVQKCIDHNYIVYTNYQMRRLRCFSGGRSGSSRWDWDGNAYPNQRSRFSDAYATDECDEDNEFRFRNAAKQRVWWSDDVDAEDGEEDDGFGILEASIGFKWVFKIFRAFGWMVPAVAISLLMGSGPNGIIMALALPLAQSAISLAADAMWGRADETPRSKSKRKKRPPFTGSPGRTRVKKEETRTQMRKEAGSYKSWFEGNNVSAEKESRNRHQNFGGWDELDNPVRANKDPSVAHIKQEEERRADETFKISRRTKGDTPLFMRLLIALFPFLGFWTKLF
ncbi:hypothetical protein C2S52_003219 [Perilla frutescens var. hirtella]|nr:hypothetical protein C2S51_012268 [Perilla frutescens var. frutescens]KAH6792742.1 hypothetical protein C2S52_003219 [Perilla frutescens var. hirtella]